MPVYLKIMPHTKIFVILMIEMLYIIWYQMPLISIHPHKYSKNFYNMVLRSIVLINLDAHLYSIVLLRLNLMISKIITKHEVTTKYRYYRLY